MIVAVTVTVPAWDYIADVWFPTEPLCQIWRKDFEQRGKIAPPEELR